MLQKNRTHIKFIVDSSPIFWKQKADESRYAASLLLPYIEAAMQKAQDIYDKKIEMDIENMEPHIFPIYLSLLGFSTECLFKGTAILKKPSLVAHGNLPKELRHHDLVELAKTAGITLTQNERIFCEHAIKAMTIDSRYPVAMYAIPDKGFIEVGGDCRVIFEEIYQKLSPALKKLNKVK